MRNNLDTMSLKKTHFKPLDVVLSPLLFYSCDSFPLGRNVGSGGLVFKRHELIQIKRRPTFLAENAVLNFISRVPFTWNTRSFLPHGIDSLFYQPGEGKLHIKDVSFVSWGRHWSPFPYDATFKG